VNWREARDILDGKGKRRGPRDRVKIARNTYLERGSEFRGRCAKGYSYPDNAIGLLYHATYVLVFTPHWIEYFTGGWVTMSTRDRMEYGPVSIRATHGGWTLYLVRDDLPCYCMRDGEDVHDVSGPHEGIVIQGEYQPGRQLRFTNEYDPSVPSENYNGAPVYEWRTCQFCAGTTLCSGYDFDSGGHLFFDGIRISNDGKRLLRTQPHKPSYRRPVRTESGFVMSGVDWRGY
jgi:hypothetical protein